MAGIGFRLQRILASNSYGSLAAAYGYSAIIASGPWMLSMLSLMGIGAFMAADPGAQGEAANPVDIFGTVTTYVYAGSILLGGTIHQGVSRYISDRLYASEMEGILPAFLSSASMVLVLGLVCAGPWFAFSGLPAAEAFAAFLMFQSLSLTWLAMVFLSAAKGYGQIVGGFCGANAVGVILAVLGYRYFALTGVLAGYGLGQFLLAIWLSWRIFLRISFLQPLRAHAHRLFMEKTPARGPRLRLQSRHMDRQIPCLAQPSGARGHRLVPLRGDLRYLPLFCLSDHHSGHGRLSAPCGDVFLQELQRVFQCRHMRGGYCSH